MKIKNMTVLILAILVIAVGTILSIYMSDFKKEESVKLDKSKLIIEVSEQKKSIILLKSKWLKSHMDDERYLLKLENKYLNEPKVLQSKIDENSRKNRAINESFRNDYNQKIKIKTKTVKKDCESYLKIYKTSKTSYAEYDRVYGFYDLDKLINDLDYLETQLRSE